jgi:hypothetical protein
VELNIAGEGAWMAPDLTSQVNAFQSPGRLVVLSVGEMRRLSDVARRAIQKTQEKITTIFEKNLRGLLRSWLTLNMAMSRIANRAEARFAYKWAVKEVILRSLLGSTSLNSWS